MHRPIARSDELVTQQLAEEILVFDRRRCKAHCLNRTTALVWRNCDGRNSLSALAQIVGQELGIAGCEVLVQLALEQLASRHLLETPIERGSAAQRRSRREVLKRLAAATALPVILTLKAPRANAAASHGPCSGKPDGTICGSKLTQICCSGTCCGLNQGCLIGGCCGLSNSPCTVANQCCSQTCNGGKCA